MNGGYVNIASTGIAEIPILLKASADLAGNQTITANWLLSANNEIDLASYGAGAGSLLSVTGCRTGGKKMWGVVQRVGVIISPEPLTNDTELAYYLLTPQETQSCVVFPYAVRSYTSDSSDWVIHDLSGNLHLVELTSSKVYVSLTSTTANTLGSGTYDVYAAISCRLANMV